MFVFEALTLMIALETLVVLMMDKNKITEYKTNSPTSFICKPKSQKHPLYHVSDFSL